MDCTSMSGLRWSVSENQQPERLLAHLDAGNDPDAGEHGRTLLFIAAHQNPTAVRLLLERGADPDRADGISGLRPLHQAARVGNVDAVKLLLDAGAAVDPVDPYGNSPLFYALNGHPPPVREVVELLLERGADPTRRNKFGVVASTLVEADHKDPVIRELVRRAVERRS